MLNTVLKSRTLTFGALLMIASVAQIALPYLPLEPRLIGMVGAVVSAAIIVLRFLTTVPVGEK